MYLRGYYSITLIWFIHSISLRGGFCDEASTPDGIYYKQVNNLPEDWDMETGESIPPPRKLKYLKD